MKRSLTARIGTLSDAVRDLRCRVHTLALFLLEDDHGISERSMKQLRMLLEEVGGVRVGPVDATDGRFYMSREEV